MAHPHGLGQRDIWDTITSAVGGIFDPSDDKDSTKTESAPASTTKTDNRKTIVKTVLTTSTPEGYSGPLTTKTKAAAKTTPTTTAASTSAEDEDTTTKTSAKATTKSSSTTKTAAKTTEAKTTEDTSTGLPTSIASTVQPSETKLAIDTSLPTTTTASITSAAASATPTASTVSSGPSAGAKAGIAIGVLAGIFFVFAIVFFLFRRHRSKVQAQRAADDEKVNGPFADSAAIGGGAAAGAAGAAGAAAGSQFASGLPNRRQSRGANIAMQNQPPMGARLPQADGAGERPMTANDSSNPFGAGAQRLPQNLDANGVSPVSPGGAGASFAGGAAAGAAAGMLTRKASTRKDGPNALDLTLAAPNNINNLGPVPPSPAGTEYSMQLLSPGASADASASGAAIAAAGGPAMSTVHRVQLDFKPTLEDELELRAGQLVRLLHEYDDGWVSYKLCSFYNTFSLVETRFTNLYRHFASVLTAPSRVLFPARACLRVL